jgi:threonine dehydratase
VTDEEVKVGMRAALEHLKLVLEPSGASALAAALVARRRGVELGNRVCVVCSGGNIAAGDFAKLVAEEARH